MCCVDFTSEKESVLTEIPLVRIGSLQEALAECDWDLLADLFIDLHVIGLDRLSEFGARRIRAVQDKVRGVLEEMSQVETTVGYHGRRVLVPRETFQLDKNSLAIRRRIDACCVSEKDLEDGAFLYDDPQVDFGFADLPWEQVLAMPFWYYSTFCDQERYMMLASAVWEMTRFGYTREEQEDCWDRKPCAPDGTDGMLVNVAPSFQTKRPAGFDWSYRQRMRSRIIELNRNAEENFFIALEGLGSWYRTQGAKQGVFSY